MSKEKRLAAREIKSNDQEIKRHQSLLAEKKPGSVLHTYHLKRIQTLTDANNRLRNFI